MADFWIAPLGRDAIEAGTLIDADGQRLVRMRFETADDDVVNITMPIPLFQSYAEHLAELAREVGTRDYWRDHPRG